MAKTILRLENVSKQYRLGEVGTGTISHDLNRWWAKFRGKEDPNLKIGEANDRTQKGDSAFVWVLKDISFEVQQGEVLGIIGKNGAGKSTLLKILSKVTGPTSGRILANGRIAALLEVGTGFHPELTGRENVYLNGAILGMTKQEIRSKFNEIVDFAGVERYIDTPVKRYSSGMMVRLGFAVAAHLEPEILIVDEVLAVGDIEFQKKCLGKMNEVSKSGRTVLFVSHNMNAVRNLCTRCVVIENGELVFNGDTGAAIDRYLENEVTVNASYFEQLSFESTQMKLSNFEVCVNGEKKSYLNIGDNFKLTFEYFFKQPIDLNTVNVAFRILDDEDRFLSNEAISDKGDLIPTNNMKGKVRLDIPDIRFYPGKYRMQLYIASPDWMQHFIVTDPFNVFEVSDSAAVVNRNLSKAHGQFFLNSEWEVTFKS